jgi:hypothetical protein
MTAGFGSGHPPCDMGSRFRGNCKRGCRDSSLPRVLGVSPNYTISPKSGGPGVESEHGNRVGGLHGHDQARVMMGYR